MSAWSAWPLLLAVCIGIAAMRVGHTLRRVHRGGLLSLTTLGVVLGVGGIAILIVAPIVLGVALIALALAYDNGQQLGVGIALLAGGLLFETLRDVFL
jgi:4-hydroxybenzoate polyprenyltransferase